MISLLELVILTSWYYLFCAMKELQALPLPHQMLKVYLYTANIFPFQSCCVTFICIMSQNIKVNCIEFRIQVELQELCNKTVITHLDYRLNSDLSWTPTALSGLLR